MGIRVVPHTRELRAAAREFNARMHAAGSPWGVYVDIDADWLIDRSGKTAWREHHLVVDDEGFVRGGFVLKPQEWLIGGFSHIVTDWQGPVSEGSVDPRFAALAIRLMREMVKLYPALFSWGHGGSDQPVVEMLRKMKWPMHATPVCLLIVKPFRFARRNQFLRKKWVHRAAMDLMAFSGLGYLVSRGVSGLKRLSSRVHFSAKSVEVDSFGPWADELWVRCKGMYAAIACRDSASMNLLAPIGRWPPVTRLRIEKGGATLGWALVMDTQMKGDARFGDLYVGSVVDCLADPADAGEIVWAATQFLRAKGVDVVLSNQAHPAWVKGFDWNGYLVIPNKRLFVVSPALHDLLAPFDETVKGLHLTNMDGHGPHAL